jgi:hypothetical protein
MTMATQYVAAKFRPTDKRTYTYANDGDPVAVGDKVKVPDPREDGWVAVEVVAIVDKPAFVCKPILGKVELPAVIPEAAEKATTALAPTVGHGAIVEGFRWRTRDGDRIAPAAMETRHLFYSLRMIWNNHVPPEQQVGRDVKLYSFPSFYTHAYFEEAITNLAAVLFRRPDLAPWQRRELEQMAAHTARRAPQQLALEGGGTGIVASNPFDE